MSIPFPEPLTSSQASQRQSEDSVEQPMDLPSKRGEEGKKQWFSFIVRVGVTLLLFAFLFKSLSWSTVLVTLAHVQYIFLLLGLGVGTFGLTVSSSQWRSLLRAERIHIGLGRLLKLYILGITFSHFLPTGMGGDVVKAFYVGREAGNHAGSASAVVMSRITGFLGMLLVACAALLLWHGYFTSTIALTFALLSLLVGSMIAGAVFSTILLPKLAQGKWLNHGIYASIIRIGTALGTSARRPRSLYVGTWIGVLFWLVASLNYYSYALALGMNVPLYFYFVAIPLVSLIAFLPISINGFGIRETAFVYIFSTVHVPVATSLLLAFLMDLQVLFFGAIGGCFYLTMNSTEKVVKQHRILTKRHFWNRWTRSSSK